MVITKIYCDRCGDELDSQPTPNLVIGQVANNAVSKFFDLCPSCQKGFETWFRTCHNNDEDIIDADFREVEEEE